MLVLDRKYKNLKSSGFIGKNTGKKYRIKFTSEKLRYINLFEHTSIYNTYKKGFLAEENVGWQGIELGNTTFIIEPLGREILATYIKKRDNINEDFLRTENLKITLIKGLDDKKEETERIVKVVGLNSKTESRRYVDFYVSGDKIFVEKLEDMNWIEKAQMPERYKKIINEILEIENEQEQEQLILNLMYFSYFFEVLTIEDLKNEQYLELIWLLISKKVEKPQKKVKGHRNLNLMYELLKWIDKSKSKDFLFLRNLDILKVLDQLTNDNLYFLQMYFTHPEKEIFNYNKFSKTEEDGELIQKALDKFMSLTSYKFKEAIALNFKYKTILKKLVSGEKRNDIYRAIKLNNALLEKNAKATKERNIEKRKQHEILMEQERTKRELLYAKRQEELSLLDKELQKETDINKAFDLLKRKRPELFGIIMKKKLELRATSLKKSKEIGTIEKLLKNSKIIKIAKSIKDISAAGRKASCCLHSTGILRELAKWIENNNQMVCLYGTINNKNFQILSYLKININNYSRTLVLDNVEANKTLTEEEYNILLKELKTKMRGYGIIVGKIRTDVEDMNEREHETRTYEEGLIHETYNFHDSYIYVTERKAKNMKINTNELLIRKATESDLIQITQIERKTYGLYDEENTFVTEFLEKNEEIYVISDKERNIYGYSAIRMVKTEFDLDRKIKNPEIDKQLEHLRKQKALHLEKREKEYKYIEDFNVITELRKTKWIYKLAEETVKGLRELSEDPNIYYHSNENSKSMEHYLLKKGFIINDLREITEEGENKKVGVA